MTARILATAIVALVLALVPAAVASATVSPSTGQPNVTCPTPPNVPGFNSGGFQNAESVYAGATTTGKSAHSNSTATVSQYDIACFRP